jgi:Putative adhesin
MPVFDTPEPIAVQIDLPVGDAWIAATDRTDTVVQVRPRNASSKADVNLAEQTTVEYAVGRLMIRAPKSWRRFAPGAGPSVDILVKVPTGSTVQAEAAWAAFRCEGRLGECRFKTGGTVRLDQTGPLEVDSSHGEVVVERANGAVRVTASSGKVRLGEVDGAVEIKNSSGDCWIGQSTGDVRAKTAYGDVTVDRALASISARSNHGNVRIGEVSRGSVDVQTSYGGIEIGVRRGTAAWLELSSRHGRVHNGLDATDGPAQNDDTVEVRASTNYGDIMIRRAA